MYSSNPTIVQFYPADQTVTNKLSIQTLSRKALLILLQVIVKQHIIQFFKQTLKCLDLQPIFTHSTHQIAVSKDGRSVIRTSTHHERSIWHDTVDQPKAEITLQKMKAMTC